MLPLQADPLMSLPQLDGYQVFTIDDSGPYKGNDNKTYTGKCGSAKILVKNVSDDRMYEQGATSFSYLFMPAKYDDERFVISGSDKSSPVLRPPANDFNGIACVQTPKGKRVLIWETCGGSVCSDRFDDFYVIDPEKLVYIAPKDPKKNLCDEKCARRLVGNALIDHIEGDDDIQHVK
jgi:hypothetical protein